MDKQSAFAEVYAGLLAVGIRVNTDDSTPSSPFILHEAAFKVARKYVSSYNKEKEIIEDMDKLMLTCQRSAWRRLPMLDDNSYTQSEMGRIEETLFALLQEQANARQRTVDVGSVYYIINCVWDMIIFDLERDRVYLSAMHFEVMEELNARKMQENPFSDTNTDESVNPSV